MRLTIPEACIGMQSERTHVGDAELYAVGMSAMHKQCLQSMFKREAIGLEICLSIVSNHLQEAVNHLQRQGRSNASTEKTCGVASPETLPFAKCSPRSVWDRRKCQ